MNNRIPEVVYFGTYMAICDNRLYDLEWFRIEKYISDYGFGDDVRNNALLIIKSLPEKRELDDVIRVLSRSDDFNKLEALYLGLQIAFADRNLGEKEQVLFDVYRKRLHISRSQFQSIEKMAKNMLEVDQGKSTVNDEIADRYGNSLFQSNTYLRVIEKLSIQSGEDTEIVQKALNEVALLYRTYPDIIRMTIEKVIKPSNKLSTQDEKRQIMECFEKLRLQIDNTIEKENRILENLNERQSSSIGNYTISFMGRTKAGKSTLHSVLLGGINNDFIGNGSERTTRYNYIYDFHGLRIIDTPGIGAPGGQDDVAIAESIMDESDLICYIVTSDSIQETEFNFLRKVKERNKPVIILLNKKENFNRSTKKREAFLSDPLAWYESDDENSIQGHIDRIDTYVAKNHEYHNYKIIPVHLLAAKLALTEKNEETRNRLFEASRIYEFLNELETTINSYGILLKSQTIYNAAGFHLRKELENSTLQIQTLQTLRAELSKNEKGGKAKIEQYRKKMRNELIESYNATFDQFIADDVRRFANQNYGCKKKEIEGKWNKFLKETHFDQELSDLCERIFFQYNEKVEEVLEEINENLNFSSEYGILSDIKMKVVFDTKTLVEVAGVLVGFVGAILIIALETNPIGWILTGVGVVAGVASLFIKPKKKKVEEAQETLYNSLVDNIQKSKKDNLAKVLQTFDQNHGMVMKKISGYYGVIVQGFHEVEERLKELKEKQNSRIEYIDKAFAVRIAGFITENIHYVEVEEAMKTMKITRQFGKSLEIMDDELYLKPIKVNLENVSSILQEDIRLEWEE